MSVGSDIRQAFKSRPGKNHIASAYAIDGLAKWLSRTRPKAILEVGAGIGTLTTVLISYLDEVHGPGQYRLVSIEAEPDCLERLDENLGSERAKVTVVDRYEAISPGMAPFDFIIIDGGGPYPEDGEHELDFVTSQNLLFTSELARNGIVFVEKNRERQREWVMEVLQDRESAYCHYQPWTAGAGYHIYWFEPAASVARELALRDLRGSLVRGVNGLARSLKSMIRGTYQSN